MYNICTKQYDIELGPKTVCICAAVTVTGTRSLIIIYFYIIYYIFVSRYLLWFFILCEMC